MDGPVLQNQPRRWRAGAIAFDERTNALTVGEAVCAIEPIPRRILWRLLCEGGAPVPKELLIGAGWSSTRSLSDASFYNAIKRLRETLGPDGSSLVALEPGRGYRITAPVSAEPSPALSRPVLALRPGDEVPRRPGWRLAVMLGGSPACDVWLACDEAGGEPHVFRFAETQQRLAALRSMATASIALSNGPLAANFETIVELNERASPFWLESIHAGVALPEWLDRSSVPQSVLPATRLEFMTNLARSLAEAHRLGVIHGNLSPGKILVDDTPDGPMVRLAGFRGDTHPSPVAFPYRPPELEPGQTACAATDIYGLGILLFQAVSRDFGKPLTAGWEAAVADPLMRADIGEAAAGDPHRRMQSASLLAERLSTLDLRRDEQARQRAHDEECARLREAAEAHRVEALLATERAALNARLAARTRKAAALCLCLALAAMVFGTVALRAEHAAALQSRRAERTTRIVDDTLSGVIGEIARDLRDRSGVTLAMRQRILDRAGSRLSDMRALAPADPLLADLEASALTEFSSTYLQQGDLAAAARSAMRAVDIRERLLRSKPGGEALQAGLAESRRQLGDTQLQERDLRDARSNYEASRALVQNLALRHPDDEALQQSLALSFESSGRALDEQGDGRAALADYDRAAAIAAHGLARHPDDASWQETWATAQTRRGDALSTLGRLADALAANEAGLAMQNALFARDSTNMRWLRNLAVAWMDVGDERSAGNDQAAALLAYGKGLSLHEALSRTDASNSVWQTDVALSESDVADAAAATGDMAIAARHYEAGLARLRDLTAARPEDIALQRISFVLENNYAFNLAKAGRQKDAQSHVLRALALAKDFQKHHPDDPFSRRAMEEARDTARSLGYLLVPGD